LDDVAAIVAPDEGPAHPSALTRQAAGV